MPSIGCELPLVYHFINLRLAPLPSKPLRNSLNRQAFAFFSIPPPSRVAMTELAMLIDVHVKELTQENGHIVHVRHGVLVKHTLTHQTIIDL